jgi:uncharacterized repeat protein (TIGR01451 family)
VTNPGNAPLSGVVVSDDNGTPGDISDDFNATFAGGDTSADGLLDTTETWSFTASRIATAGQHTNTATATGTDSLGGPVSDNDTDNHFGSGPAIDLVKLTNGTDNNTAPGPAVPVGSTVTFTYNVSNSGNVSLSGVAVVDDAGTVATGDDFNATFTGGDTNTNTLLDTGEVWTFTATRIATFGPYANNATATGTPPVGSAVSDSDVDHHSGDPGAAVPTMEEWMLILMIAMFGVIAGRRLTGELV